MPARTGSTLARSVRLLREFRHEQSDPQRFYTAVAQDAVRQLEGWAALAGAVVVDVGSGHGLFRQAFEGAGARYVALDLDLEVAAADIGEAVVGDGRSLPLRSGAVDVCCSFNALEHLDDPWRAADEMVRVTRSQGTVVISYTSWWGPWGGHETAPWHFLGGHRARRRYERVHRHPPKNVYGRSLFAVSVAEGLRWARRQEAAGLADVVAVLPRYHPRWATWLVQVPVVRELLSWNLVMVVRPR